MSNRWSGGADLTLTLCLQYSPFTSSAMLITGCQCLSGMLVLLCLIYCRSEYYKWWWAAMQWHQNEFERGGDTDLKWSAGKKIFGSCPSTFLAVKVQSVVLVRTFVMIGTVWSVSCLPFSTPGAPVPSHLSKWGGDTGPSTPILYGVGDCSRATVLTVDLESSCSKCVLRPNVCMQMTTLKTVQKPGLAKRHPM